MRRWSFCRSFFFFFQAEDGIRDWSVTGVQTCALPIWGPDSFNDGAGLHRLLTAARFVKAKMPLGKAELTDDEAFDVTAFLNSKPRPQMANLDRDYPDRSKKPVDTPYPPYADSFTITQHQLGPFQPIDAYYSSKP